MTQTRPSRWPRRPWVVLLFFFVGGVASAEKATSIEAILDRMEAAYQNLSSLAASVEQVKSYPQLGVSDPAERGEILLKRRGEGNLLVRLEIREPEQRILTVKDDGSYMLYQPKIRQAIEGKSEKVGRSGARGTGLLSTLLGDLSEARRDYDIDGLGEEEIEDHRTVHLRLTAKPGANPYYPQVDLWVDTELGIPVQQELVEPNRSVTKLRFRDVRVNVELEDGLFTIHLPKGVERVRG